MLRLFRQISLRQLRASWGRTSLIVGGVAVGIALVVAINVINRSVLDGFRNAIELLAGPAALEVTLGVGEVGFPESVADTVRADPDVRAVVPLVHGTISLADDPRETLQLFGTDLTAEEELRRYQVTAATDRRQALRALEDPRSLFLTTAFAVRHGVGVGRTVRLSTPSGVDNFTVRAVLETEGVAAAFGGQLAVMDLPAAQHLLGKDQRVDQVDVVLRDGADPAVVAHRLTIALPDVLTVAAPAQRAARYDGVLAAYQAMLTGLSTLCLVAGFFIIYNTTATGALHRALVMAGLRLIGATPEKLLRLLMLEAVILGTIGTALGMVIGIGLASLLTGLVTDSMGINFQLRFPVHGVSIDPAQQALIAVAGVATAVCASYLAVRRVARLDPLEVMRTDPRTIRADRPSSGLVVLWAGLVAISALALLAEERLKSAALGNLGSTLWNVSVIVIAIPMVGWLAGLLKRILPALWRAEGQMAAESLFRSVRRTGVTAAAIALVLTVAVGVSSLSLSFRRSMIAYIGRVLSGDLAVSAVTTEGGWLETPIPDSLVSEMAAIPGVAQVEAGRIMPGQVYGGERIGLLALTDGAFDPVRYPAGWYREGKADDAVRALRAGTGLLASTTLSDRLGLHVGDRMRLPTPTGQLDLPIVGVVPDYVGDRGSVILSRRLLIERWGERTVSRIHLFLEPGASLEQVRQDIAGRVGDRYRLKILSLREVLEYHDRMLNRAFAFSSAIQILIVIVTVCGIFDLLLSSIAERRRELALWRLVGADDRVVGRSVTLESVTIGALGAVMGVAVGLVTAWTWIRFNFRYLIGYELEYHFALGSALWCVILVLVMTILTGLVAAQGAIRQSVLIGIRDE